MVIASSQVYVLYMLDDDFRGEGGAAVEHNELPAVPTSFDVCSVTRRIIFELSDFLLEIQYITNLKVDNI